jgi:4-amino-4-deoxy-L-arabinose transferase-like glycosyltransferase
MPPTGRAGGPSVPPPSDPPRTRLRELLLDPRAHAGLLLAGAALVIFARAGGGPLANFDDAYYAEKARQMLRTGDWLTPRFGGIERLDNPPLFLWLMAASFATLGVTSFAAMLWSALAGVACVVLTHRLALRLGREPFEAWAAGVVLLGTGYFLKYANHAMFDVFLTFLFLCVLLAYRRAWEGGAAAWVVVGVFTGLGVLTKSVLGVFPLAVVVLHTLWCGRAWRALRTGAWLAPLSAALVVLPWYWFQLTTHHDAFVREHIVWLLVQRAFGTGPEAAAAATASPFGYLRELAVNYWPWLPFALAGAWLALRPAFTRPAPTPDVASFPDAAAARLLLLWPLVVIGVMSLASEKKLWYVMSAFPALALLSARALAAWVKSDAARARVTLGGFALIAAAGTVLALTPFGSPPPRQPDLQTVAHAARTLVPEQGRIVLVGGGYYSVAHQFIFTSDRALVPGPDDAAQVRAALDAGDWALVPRAGYTGLVAADSLRYPAVLSSGRWMLVHAAPAPRVTLAPTNPFR